jgi:hypothetical protein
MPRPRKVLAPKPSKEQMFVKVGQRPASVNEALKEVHKSGAYTGFLGEGDVVKKPDYVPPEEILDTDGIARKKAVTDLLIKTIEPNQLSSKSTPEMDKRALFSKLKKSSLDELLRFLPSRVKKLHTEQLQAELTNEEKLEVQDNYKEISP